MANVLDRNWKDTWHIGGALLYLRGPYAFTFGMSYDSSPVNDSNRTLDLPLDEVLKFNVAAIRPGPRFDLGIGATLLYLGDGKVDQSAQGVRVAGEFDTNLVLIVGGLLNYKF